MLLDSNEMKKKADRSSTLLLRDPNHLFPLVFRTTFSQTPIIVLLPSTETNRIFTHIRSKRLISPFLLGRTFPRRIHHRHRLLPHPENKTFSSVRTGIRSRPTRDTRGIEKIGQEGCLIIVGTASSCSPVRLCPPSETVDRRGALIRPRSCFGISRKLPAPRCSRDTPVDSPYSQATRTIDSPTTSPTDSGSP